MLDHHPDQVLEARSRLPPELEPRLGRVADERHRIARAHELGVDHDVRVGVEVDDGEGRRHQLANGPAHAAADHVVVARVLLEHQPHRLRDVAGEAPVAPGVQVAQVQLVGEAELDRRGGAGDLAADELRRAARRLVVVEDPRARVHAVALAVGRDHQVPVELGHRVGVVRDEGRGLVLGRLARRAEHLRGRRLIDAQAGLGDAHRFEHRRHAHGGELRRHDGLAPRGGHEGRGGQVVELVGLGSRDGIEQRHLVEQVALKQADVVLHADQVRVRGVRRAADDAEDLVARARAGARPGTSRPGRPRR